METAVAAAPESIRERHASTDPATSPTGSSGSESDSDGGAQPGGTAPAGSTEPAAPITLTLAERQAFYWELIEAQDRAVIEADAKYPMDADPPDVDSYVALWIELNTKYEAEVRTKYGLSPAQANVVVEEGLANNWPMPPYPG
jgi:hypothetical protein